GPRGRGGRRGGRGGAGGRGARGQPRPGEAACRPRRAADRHGAGGLQSEFFRRADGGAPGTGADPRRARGRAGPRRAAGALPGVERTAGDEMTLHRSFLFAPGNVARRVEKALTLDADVVIVDLEDSVADSEKAATRKLVAEALQRPRRARGYVRVNAPSSPYCHGDLMARLSKGVDGVGLPQVESAADLHAVDWLIWNLELERGIAPGSIDLMPQIE